MNGFPATRRATSRASPSDRRSPSASHSRIRVAEVPFAIGESLAREICGHRHVLL